MVLRWRERSQVGRVGSAGGRERAGRRTRALPLPRKSFARLHDTPCVCGCWAGGLWSIQEEKALTQWPAWPHLRGRGEQQRRRANSGWPWLLGGGYYNCSCRRTHGRSAGEGGGGWTRLSIAGARETGDQQAQGPAASVGSVGNAPARSETRFRG